MHLEDAIAKLRSLNEPVPKPARLPTETEVAAAERNLGVEFPPDYHHFLLQASDVTYGSLEPAVIIPAAGRSDLVKMAREAWEIGVPEDLLPFCESNGDYFCLHADGQVVYWHHDGSTDETWPDLAHWIVQVWMEEEEGESEDEED
ncbi:MAG: SMI1/KNR4 family protein [Verrucomicrobiota bacterium]